MNRDHPPPITHHSSPITLLFKVKLRELLKSPIFPLGQKWDFKKRTDGYESDTTALIRRMLEDESVREDQRWAWERWRNDATPLKNRDE